MDNSQNDPVWQAFQQNLRFLNQKEYPAAFFQGLFQPDGRLQVETLGDADFPTGEVILADPLVYLGTKYETRLARRIKPGSYPVQVAIFHSKLVGLRYAAARLVLAADRQAVRYEIAMDKGHTLAEFGKPGVFTLFGVDAGLACITDAKVAYDYAVFDAEWNRWCQRDGKFNIYDHYFAELFAQSYAARPDIQREGGDFLCWQLPEGGQRLIMFSSGMGDGVYSAYWGLDAEGQLVELVIPFINPDFF